MLTSILYIVVILLDYLVINFLKVTTKPSDQLKWRYQNGGSSQKSISLYVEEEKTVKVNIKLIKKYKIKLIKKFNVVFPENVTV